MSRIIKVGLVGCGWIMENAHIPVLLSNSHAKIKSCFDVDIEKAKKIKKKVEHIEIYDNYDLFLNSGINAVIIAVPNYLHYIYAKKTLEKNINVLCEKPIVLTNPEIYDLYKIVESNKRIFFMPAFVNRFRRDIEMMMSLLREKYIGKINKINAHWIRKNGVPKLGSWFTHKEYSGGGVLIDLGSHVLDIVNVIANSELKKCNVTNIYDLDDKEVESAPWFDKLPEEKMTSDVESTTVCNILYNNGVLADVILSWNNSNDGDETSFEIIGEKGKIELVTLFGFSNIRKNKNITLKVNVSNQYKEYIYDYDNLQLEAFRKMDDIFIYSIINRENECIGIKDAVRTVTLINELYNNEYL